MADCKRKTANLFDKSSTAIHNAYFNDADRWLPADDSRSIVISVKGGTQYTLSVPEAMSVFRICEASQEPVIGNTYSRIVRASSAIDRYTFTTQNDTKYIIFQGGRATVDTWFNGLMLNSGSTPLPYEPYWQHSLRKLGTSTDTITTLPTDIYADGTNATVGLVGNMSQTGTPSPDSPIQPSECGDLETEGAKEGQYKIPILNNSQTTNVYLGEVESTRKIRELVLTGDDGGTWTYNGVFTNGNAYYNATIFTGYSPNKTGICSHLDAVTDTTATEGVYWGANANFITKIADGIDTPEKWRNYLAAQYAAGTPVCVWYVLATPQTAVVNEPLRKLDTYADEVSGITIPTIAGANTISVGTTLQPSEVTVNYKGWHPVQSVHEAGRTVNIYDKYNTIDMTIGKRYGIYVDNIGFYSIYNNTDNDVLWFDNNGQGRFIACSAHSTATVQITGVQPFGFFMPYNDESLGEVTIVQGSTAPDHYIPYIDWG